MKKSFKFFSRMSYKQKRRSKTFSNVRYIVIVTSRVVKKGINQEPILKLIVKNVCKCAIFLTFFWRIQAIKCRIYVTQNDCNVVKLVYPYKTLYFTPKKTKNNKLGCKSGKHAIFHTQKPNTAVLLFGRPSSHSN